MSTPTPQKPRQPSSVTTEGRDETVTADLPPPVGLAPSQLPPASRDRSLEADAERYAQRQDPVLGTFRGGGVVILVVVILVVVAAVLLLVLLL